MGSTDSSSDSEPERRMRSDRFVPARDGLSMNTIYSVIDEGRTQSNQSPDPTRGMKCDHASVF
jgi:hypothetical protein